MAILIIDPSPPHHQLTVHSVSQKRTAHFHLSFRFNLDMIRKDFLLRTKQKGVDVDIGTPLFHHPNPDSLLFPTARDLVPLSQSNSGLKKLRVLRFLEPDAHGR